MTERRTNADRAKRALTALQAYAAANGEVVQAETVPDLLADLHHYLAVHGSTAVARDMQEVLALGRDHYECERE